MKRLILLLTITTMLIGCTSSKDKNLNQTVTHEDSIMLLGEVNRDGLKMDAFDSWFGPGYNDYQPKPEVIKELKPLMKDVEITVFLGTWCEDSHRDIPDFFRVLDEVGFNESKLTMYAVDEEKVTPEKEVLAYDIKQVPTFIFYRDGEEINRIVEYSMYSLEQDMLDILSGKNYINPYSDF